MIASNKHGYPPLEPGSSCEQMIDLTDIYLELMFGELPAADGSAKAAMLDVNPRNDRTAAPAASAQMQPVVSRDRVPA